MKRMKPMVIKNSCPSGPERDDVAALEGKLSLRTFFAFNGVPSQELFRRIGIPSDCAIKSRKDASHTTFATSAARAHCTLSLSDKLPLAFDNDCNKSATSTVHIVRVQEFRN